MNSSKAIELKPLRLWPGITAAALLLFFRYIFPIIFIDPTAVMISVFGGLLFGLAIIIWWAFFSRAPVFERWFAIAFMVLAMIITAQFLHVSIKTAMMGNMFMMFSIPVLTIAFVAWAVLSRNLAVRRCRLITMTATIILASGFWVLLRTEGMTGDARHDLVWRWSQTYEEEFLDKIKDQNNTLASISDTISDEAAWPGFRGLNRDAVVYGIAIKTNWNESPPDELWRKPVGPGCSSFAVQGDYFFTQEQHDESEVVSCYKLLSGDPVWIYKYEARFWDSHVGAGPRSTPTLHKGKVYTMGATGILNAINANDGSLIWTRNTIQDADVKHSGWGYSSSPLVVDNIVLVALVGTIAAYDINTGDPIWLGKDTADSYSSPHLAWIDEVKQVILLNGGGAKSYDPSNGRLFWEYKNPGGSRVVQPTMIKEGEFLIGEADITGICRIKVSHEPDGWKVTELWKSPRLRPNHNDLVVHKNHAYGFDGASVACIDLESGKRRWKYGRYDGQMLLLADQDLLLVTSVDGEISLIKATPEHFNEIAKIQAIEGKTWNHPVIVGDILLHRNTREMVAYKLDLLSKTS
jgi:outer membrane protein assembly factor BamB